MKNYIFELYYIISEVSNARYFLTFTFSFITFHGDRIADQIVDIIDVKDFLIFTWLLIILRD